jgi:hypothetical protein
MNKQKNRYTPFTGKYRMPVDEFCMKYGLDLKLVMRRMNTLYWEDFDALVIPQELGSTPADKIRRILEMKKQNWDNNAIRHRIRVDVKTIERVEGLDDYIKSLFLNMDNYFYLNPSKVDLDRVFTPVKLSVKEGA